jgi:hypothetical protein
MPREFLPAQRKREGRSKAELFPRTESRVMAGPARDRMMRSGNVMDRRTVKAGFRELAMQSPAAALAHVED